MLQFVGKNGAVQIFGVKLVGVTAESGKKLLFCIVFILLVMLLGWTLRTVSQMILRKKSERTRFWTRQGDSPFLGGAADYRYLFNLV